MSEAPFNDPARALLLTELNTALHEQKVFPTVWAMLWMADIEPLKKLVEEAKADPNKIWERFIKIEHAKILHIWATKVQWPPNTKPHPSIQPELRPPKDPRHQEINPSTSAKKVAIFRDNNACVLTGMSDIFEVAHIIPYNMRNIFENYEGLEFNIWSVLRWFYSSSKIDRLTALLYNSRQQTERSDNLICIQPSFHHVWERGVWALKPLDGMEPSSSLTVEFHWLFAKKREQSMSYTITERPPLQLENSHQGVKGIQFWSNKSNRLLKTGDRIVFRTDDIVGTPIPNREFLEFQWWITRVCAISGAVGYEEDEDNSEDEDEDDDKAALQAIVYTSYSSETDSFIPN